jgi:AcrR family transcriptional regulator
MSKTLTPRQIERRKAVLRTVRDHLEQYGFDGVTIREVAQAARVSPSTLYEIYGSKEALIWTAVSDNLRDLAIEEERYEPGLERFVRRLESIARIFEETPKTAEVLSRLFFEGGENSPANSVFLDNAIEARKTSLQEMLDARQLKKDFEIQFHARALVSVTWGTVLFWLKGLIAPGDFRAELIRSSLSMILPEVTTKSRGRAREIIEQCSAE